MEHNKHTKFSIHIKQIEDNIIFDVFEADEINRYSKKLSLKDFYELDKSFKMYETISEVFSFLKKSQSKNGISIININNSLNLSINLFNIDDTKISISLFQKEITESELVNHEISLLKAKVKQLENKIIEISKKHDEDIERLTKLIYEAKENKSSINEFITGYSDLTFIENEIIKQLGKKIKSYNLIYKATRDGSRASDFHNQCDNANNNLSIVKTKKGKIFGGFTTKNWKEQKGANDFHKCDEKAFVFSINNKKIYNIKDKNRAIYCRNDLALFFSSQADIYIYDNCFKAKGGTNQSAYDYKGETYSLNGEFFFDLEDYEVYQVIFE